MSLRRTFPAAALLTASLFSSAALAAPAKTVTRTAYGDYYGNTAVPHQVILHFTDGSQAGTGALIFDLTAPKTDKVIALTAKDQVASAVPMVVKFFNAKEESLDKYTQTVCTTLPKMKIPTGTVSVTVEISPTGCNAPVTTTGRVSVTFTSR